MSNKEHFVEFMYPGFICVDTSSKRIDSKVIGSFEIDKRAIAFRLYSRLVSIENDIRLTSEPIEKTGWYYINAKELNADQAVNKFGYYSVAASNIRCNGIKRLAHTSKGTYEMNENDEVVLIP